MVPSASDTAIPDLGASGTEVSEIAAAETVAAHGGRGRLTRVGLGALVHDYLATRPGEAFG